MLFEERAHGDARISGQFCRAGRFCCAAEMSKEGAGDAEAAELAGDENHVDVAVIADIGETCDLRADRGDEGVRLSRRVLRVLGVSRGDDAGVTPGDDGF